MKQQVDETASWWNTKLMKQQVDETASWLNSELMKQQVDKTVSWWNSKLMKHHVSEIASWWNIKLVKQQNDKMSSWKNVQLPKKFLNVLQKMQGWTFFVKLPRSMANATKPLFSVEIYNFIFRNKLVCFTTTIISTQALPLRVKVSGALWATVLLAKIGQWWKKYLIVEH